MNCEEDEEVEDLEDIEDSSQIKSSPEEEQIKHLENDANKSNNNAECNEETSDGDEPPIPIIKKGKPFPTYYGRMLG